MFVLFVLEAPNTKTNSLCVQTHLGIKLFLIPILNIACRIDYLFLLIYLHVLHTNAVLFDISQLLRFIDPVSQYNAKLGTLGCRQYNFQFQGCF